MSKFAAACRSVRPLISALAGDQKFVSSQSCKWFSAWCRSQIPVLTERVTFCHLRTPDWRFVNWRRRLHPRVNSNALKANNACLRLRNRNETGFNNRERNRDRGFRIRCIFLITRPGEEQMSKGLNQKKDAKKKPTKTLKE